MGSLLGFIFKLVPTLFGSSSNGKGVVNSIADIVDRFIPSAKTRQENNEADKQANAESQNDARAMKFKSHDSWFDIFVDGVNRLVRPIITFGLISIWFGWTNAPDLTDIHPFYVQATLIVFTFWFGGRFVMKDVMAAIQKWQERKTKKLQEDDEILSDYPTIDDDLDGG